MAGDGNKVGELRVDIVADTTKFDAAVAKVAATKAPGAAGAAAGAASAAAPAVAAAAAGVHHIIPPVVTPETLKATASMGGLLKATTAVRQMFMRLFLPIAVSLGLAKWIDSMARLREETKHLADAYNKLGDENARSIAKRIRDLNGETDATKDLLEITNAHSAALRAKYDADIEGLMGLEGQYKALVSGMSVEELGKKFTDAYASQMRRIPKQFADLKKATEDKAAREKVEAEKKATADLIKTETDRAKQAAEAAVEAENQAKLAGLTGNDAVNEKLRQDTEKLEADRAKAMSYQEQQAIDRKLAAIKTIAEAQKAANNAADADRKKAEAEDVARRVKNEQDVSRAAQQAITDFNNTARNSLNDLLNTAGIQTGMDKIANILLAIKSSQGAV